MHSLDYFARVRIDSLLALNWEHIETFLDASDPMDFSLSGRTKDYLVCGGTEWQAFHESRALSLGWDWIQSDDGALNVSLADQPRSNILVIDAIGYDLDIAATTKFLRQIIESVPWKVVVEKRIVKNAAARRKLH